jgi:predicted methyltransferase
MQYSTFFKKQSAALIDIYQERFTKTIWQAVLLTGISFIITAVISNYSQYDQSAKKHPRKCIKFFQSPF